MGDFWAFRRMLAPVIIQIVFWIGVTLIIISGIWGLVGGDDVLERVLALVYLVLGPLLWRVVCEVLILLFRISETLTDIKNNTERKES